LCGGDAGKIRNDVNFFLSEQRVWSVECHPLSSGLDMARRSKEGSSTPKVRGRKVARAKRKTSKRTPRRRRPSVADLQEQLKRRTAQLAEAREQQAASAEVLRVISSSSGELKPVFKSMLANAMRLCEAQCGFIYQVEAGAMRAMAEIGVPAALAEYRRHHLHTGGATTPVDLMRATKKPAHVHDARKSDAYRMGNPNTVAGVELGGARTVLYIPMIKDDDIVGVINLYRQEVRPFTDEQIALLENFASQAVIAIENARLFEQTKEALRKLEVRSSELAESLQHQTATSQILSVISSSRADIQPVFDAIVDSASRLFEPCGTTIITLKDGNLHWNATAATLPDFDIEHAKAIYPLPFDPERSPSARALLSRRIIEIPDVTAPDTPEFTRKAAEAGGFQSATFVPLIKQDKGIGTIILTHLRAGFKLSEKQLALVRTFADQAVIAIENVRLFEEVQARTHDLSEALSQQTATADVLKVISRSAFDLGVVLQTLVESAGRLCEADKSVITRETGEVFYRSEAYGFPSEFMEYVKHIPVVPERGSASGRALLEGKAIHILDVLADPEYTLTEGQKLGGYRTALAVPILREGVPIGVMSLTRSEVRPFNNKQIELVSTFADQAAIAIENARLLGELRQSLQRQTATAEVLKTISRSTFDLKSVLNTLVESAARLCEADLASIPRPTGVVFDYVATYGYNPDLQELLLRSPMSADRGSVAGRAVLEGKTIQVNDVLDDPEYKFKEGQKAGGYRTVLAVPLIREGTAIGVLIMARKLPRSFSAQQIELVETFADQAVIAMENARLFEAEQQRTKELARSLADLRSAQDRLVQSEKLASLGQLTAGIAHEIKNPLNFVNNFSGLSVELLDELQEALGRVLLDHQTRREIGEIADTLRDNLGRIEQHGKRADSIVKNMLLHSRSGSGEYRPVEINAVIDESLNLAYHGARAEKQGFNITLERDFDPAVGTIEIYPQEITRVFLNLISNGFYAATKRAAEAGNGFEPRLKAATRNLGDNVEIRIRDNGTGIPSDIREKIFNPFFTTKPAGEGTGLGLSMSHDIVVKQHGGTIDVVSEPGAFTEFVITLPRAMPTEAAAGGDEN
jgi:two-component system, NtrC family, sensor kinase